VRRDHNRRIPIETERAVLFFLLIREWTGNRSDPRAFPGSEIDAAEAFAPITKFTRNLALGLTAILLVVLLLLWFGSRLFVAPMVEAGWGRILNMSSIVAAQPLPTMAVYGATKAYIVAFTDAVSMELDGTGVTATAFCPGFTSTHMVDEIAWVQPMLKWLPSFTMMEPAEVARQGYAACMRGEAVAVPGTLNRASLAMLRAQPQWLRHRLGALMGRKVAD